ncbi:MAG: MFS transporter [Candidatus Kapabacteria bacterium]|nr:MFS transporter [Candidatus Kapabacteria bacterium]
MKTLRKQRFGWYVYDWANSAFSTTVVTVFLGPYLTSVAESAMDPSGHISPFGITMHPGSWFSYCVALSVVLQVFVLPAVGAIVDRSHRKRLMLGVFALLGAIATMCLYVLSPTAHNYILGGGLFILANLAFGASVVVSNSFLTDLATPEERDAVSSRGWALGYLGGGLLLLVHLLWYSAAKDTGSNVELAIRGIIASAGLWWALFTIVPLLTLKDSARKEREPIRLRASFTQLWNTLKHLRNYPQTLLFFLAYLLYNDAVQTVLTMASVYGNKELGLGLDVLTQAILLVQFVAIAGSLMFERVAAWTSTKRAIIIALVGWCGVLLSAFFFVKTALDFTILAAIIAIVMGGTQALSRSLFSQMIPRGKEAEYFSLYEISDKGTSWIGPLAFGIALSLTNSYRWAVLSLIIFLFAGLVVLIRVNVQQAIREAEE